MIKHAAALLLSASLAAACSNNDNVIVGAAPGGSTWPGVAFDNIGSSIHGVVPLSDASGTQTGVQSDVVIMSDVPNLCSAVKAQRDYFRNAKVAYQALVLFFPRGTTCQPIIPGPRLGTFVIGRQCDEGTAAEIVAVSSPQTPTPLVGYNANGASFIALTDWSDNGGNASGNFNVYFTDPGGANLSLFYGHFKTSWCDLSQVLLP